MNPKKMTIVARTANRGGYMDNHDDFVDEYIEYRIFEDSMKKNGGRKSPKKNTGCGCLTIAIMLCFAFAFAILFIIFCNVF